MGPNKSQRETVESHKAQRLAVFTHVLKEGEVRKENHTPWCGDFTKNQSLKLNLTKELFSWVSENIPLWHLKMLSEKVSRGSGQADSKEDIRRLRTLFISFFEKICLSFNKKFIHILASCKTQLRAKFPLPKFTLQTGSLRSDNQLKCSTQSLSFDGKQRLHCLEIHFQV